MISHQHRCIFVHVPRTGGSSIESVIWPAAEEHTEANLWMGFISPYENKYQTGGLQHLLARQIRLEVGDEIFRSYFKFTILRDPFDRLVSVYEFMKERPDLREFIDLSIHDSFLTFLERIQRKHHVQWQPQRDFIVDEAGRPLVDFVGRFDRLATDAATIFAHLRISATLPHINASTRRPFDEYDCPRSRALIAALYPDDVRILDTSAQKT